MAPIDASAPGLLPWQCDSPALFGVGIGLGSALLTTNAAPWLATTIVGAFGLETAGALLVLAILAAFLIVIHLGFASATGLAAAMIPIIISVLQGIRTPGDQGARHDHDPAVRGQFRPDPADGSDLLEMAGT